MKGRRAKRKARKPRRKGRRRIQVKANRQGATRFDEHMRIARRIAKKLGRKVAKLTGKPRRGRGK